MSIDAIRFVRQHGIVLESAKGPMPSLAQAVAKTPIRGNWWTHPDGKQIFRATRLVRDCDDILVCRLVDGKITYVDRRLWPAIVRLAKYFQKDALAAIREEHSASGAHTIHALQFPRWVPSSTLQTAKAMSEEEAATQIGPWVAALMRHGKARSLRRGAGKRAPRT
jgi:hypothetical protein